MKTKQAAMHTGFLKNYIKIILKDPFGSSVDQHFANRRYRINNNNKIIFFKLEYNLHVYY
jgi:hypothetical protein